MNGSLKKNVLFCSLFLLNFSLALSQGSEVGFGLGTLNYTGDLVRTYNFKYSKPAATVFYRANLNKIISLRTSLTGGKVGASEIPLDAFAVQRNAAFDVFLMEVSSVLEYHFLNWRDSKRFVRFTPYLMGGIGLFSITGEGQKNSNYSNVQAAIPFGLGVKYIYNPKWYLSLEFGIRKTFFDYLDNMGGADPRFKNYQYGNPNDDDHYYFLGITLTRTFYTIPCPTNPYK
jgi:Domain of unknown function (DUF6089)